MKKLAMASVAGALMLPATYATAQLTMQQSAILAERVRARPPFVVGYVLAGKRGYTGRQRVCYARIFARHAYPDPRTGWNAQLNPGFLGDLWNECRITR